jgi:formylglycine-generating enzyme required for sulfatase activity
MLARKGDKATVKILDFGLAKATREQKADSGLTSAGQALGTPDYIAPEQILNAPTADIRADIYSLGATLYYLLTGRPPFKASSLYDIYQAHISRTADPLNVLRPDVPAELAALVSKMMAKEPAERFQTPGEAAGALAPFFRDANAAVKTVKASAAQAGPTMSGGDYAATQLETEADRLRRRAAKAAGSVGEQSRWERPIDFREPESPEDEEPQTTQRGRSKWLWPGVAAGVMLLGLLAAVLGGVFKVKTPDGVIVLENVPKDAEILVDGARIDLTWPGLGKPVEIRSVPGQHRVEVKKEGFKTFGEAVTVQTDDSAEVTVRMEPLVVDLQGRNKPAGSPEAASGNGSPPGAGRDVPTPSESEGFQPLFNGMDLTGWKSAKPRQSSWRVKDGVLIGSGQPVGNLYSERGGFHDFQLRVEARVNRGANSGIFLRIPFGGEWWQEYEVGLGGDATGSMLARNKVLPFSRARVSPGQWFTLEVTADKNHLVTKIGGKIVTDFFDVNDRSSGGYIGLEQCDPATVVEFRKIEIKELNGTGRTSAFGAAMPGEITNSLGMKLVLIPAGEFLMGSLASDPDAKFGDNQDEIPQHRVRISRPFCLGTTEVTQAQYRTVMGQNPSNFQGADDLPVENLTWLNAIQFCNRLSRSDRLPEFYRIDRQDVSVPDWNGPGYRLPTEAEWEYACRAGSTTVYGFSDSAAELGEFAWFRRNAGGKTHPVGQKRPNAWGLHDMSGNVWEWCWDRYDRGYYGQSPATDPPGPASTPGRAFRGGAWDSPPRLCRPADRFGDAARIIRTSTLGFRVARRP